MDEGEQEKMIGEGVKQSGAEEVMGSQNKDISSPEKDGDGSQAELEQDEDRKSSVEEEMERYAACCHCSNGQQCEMMLFQVLEV